ncbi:MULTISPECIES: class I SAM-dependent methyltransferase [unclassified Crossiella]|uniref:class I SAM-dependent methyltransferase n=1 Tax=unclassified Crossiella TaxID=2620835 RepID=UPI001FFF1BB7|nr:MULTISPECIES: class I SAM-dependent methyltransferase [unclassified Crossiella]MCK2243139.1 class I SAM-dependent methyltransferase [Crossiella sp. S99.2]MCK2257016.1 class I SAM-dependent methyltransferase [Crossiella sp. S99.1]
MDRRAAYAVELAQGLARFFEPRRATCPWCGSTRIALLQRSADLIQRKPGEFVLDRCADCRHVFQNPCLSPAGLAFYYRDFYDGLGEATMNRVFAKQTEWYRQRAELIAAHADPAEWLDVGCGHGHFCHTAHQLLPRTAFDGLDFGDGVEIAQRHGRIRRAFRGEFAELAPELTERYDVVSMHHYLEHSTDQRRELATALKVLRPGGLLLIEVPDPESPWGRLLGKWWVGWMQPQHLHFAPRANLRAALTELGFTVLSDTTDRAAVTQGWTGALMQLAHTLLPPPDFPWLPRPSRFRLLLRNLGLTAAVPLIALSALLGWLVRPIVRARGLHNSYRIVARKN